MRNLVIVGAGGNGREVYSIAKESHGYLSSFEIKGFLDSNLDALLSYPNYPPILSTVEDYTAARNDVFIITIADNTIRQKCVCQILEKGGEFINLIHLSATISLNVKMGVGCVIARNCIIGNDVKIGSHVLFNSHSMIGHDVDIKDYCIVNAGCFLGGFVKVQNGCTLQTYSAIIPGLSVGENATVGAGSVVIKNVPDNVTVFGNPAKVIFSGGD